MTKKKKIIAGVAIALAAFIALTLIVTLTVCKILLNDMFGRVDADDYSLSTVFSADETGIEKREIEFKSGKNTLRGHLWGDKSSKKLAVISHGIGAHSNDYYSEMMFFVENGFRVLTYDCTGTARSDGKGTTGLSQSPVDLHNALLFVEKDSEVKDLPIYLFGHSWGGHAVTAVLNFEHKNIKAVASIAGYDSNAGIMKEWMINTMGLGNFAHVLFPFASFWARIDSHGAYGFTGVKGINKSNLPVLAVQGGKDDTVWIDSIYNHREDITNEKFEYYFIENGEHSGILNPDDESVVAYRKQKNDAYNALYEKYNGNIPQDEEKDFFKSIDKHKYNDVNHETMGKVLEFYSKA